MVNSNFRFKISALFCAAVLLFTLFRFPLMVSAEGSVDKIADGTYSVPADNDMPMQKDSMSFTSKVEKQGENYYLSLSFDNARISNASMTSDGKQVGTMKSSKDGWTTYTYTLSKESLGGELKVDVFIVQMSREKTIRVTLDFDKANKISDTIEDRGERPAQFVPVLQTGAGSQYILKKESLFTVPLASATLGNKDLGKVAVSAYYMNGETKENVEVTDAGQIFLAALGEYHVVYRASSKDYKTSLGNDTFVEYDITILSKSGVVTIAKFTDENKILPEGTVLQASPIVKGTLFDVAAKIMRDKSNHFSLTDVSFFDASGKPVVPNGNITVYLQPDATSARTEVVVYHMNDNGELTEIPCRPYGRYVTFDTNKTGTFITCIPGVPFVMPMWGYALICVAVLLIVVLTVVIIVVTVKKKKKKTKPAESDA